MGKNQTLKLALAVFVGTLVWGPATSPLINLLLPNADLLQIYLFNKGLFVALLLPLMSRLGGLRFYGMERGANWWFLVPGLRKAGRRPARKSRDFLPVFRSCDAGDYLIAGIRRSPSPHSCNWRQARVYRGRQSPIELARSRCRTVRFMTCTIATSSAADASARASRAMSPPLQTENQGPFHLRATVTLSTKWCVPSFLLVFCS